MDFWGTVKVLRRRWYFVLPALGLCIYLALYTYSSIPTRYTSSGAMLLTSPSGAKFLERGSTDEVPVINPMLEFNGSLVISAQILVQVLNDPAIKKELGAGSDGGDDYLANNGETAGPFLFVTSDSDSADSSRELVGRALERARLELDNRQRELQAPESTFIQSQILVRPTEPTAQVGGKIRFAGAAFVISFVLTLAGTFAFDNVIRTVKKRRSRRSQVVETAFPVPVQPTVTDVSDRPRDSHAFDVQMTPAPYAVDSTTAPDKSAPANWTQPRRSAPSRTAD